MTDPTPDTGPAPDEAGEPDTVQQLQALIAHSVSTREPVLVGKGVYSLYATPEGGLHLAYRPEDATEDGHFPIPPGLMRLALAKGEGAGVLSQLRAMSGF